MLSIKRRQPFTNILWKFQYQNILHEPYLDLQFEQLLVISPYGLSAMLKAAALPERHLPDPIVGYASENQLSPFPSVFDWLF